MRSRITGSRPFEKPTVAYESLHATLSSRSTAEMLRQHVRLARELLLLGDVPVAPDVDEQASVVDPVDEDAVDSCELAWIPRDDRVRVRDLIVGRV
jgi:hypothetical protein